MNTRAAIAWRSIGLILSAVVIIMVVITDAPSQSITEGSNNDLRLGPTPHELTPDQEHDSKRIANVIARLFQERRKRSMLPRS